MESRQSVSTRNRGLLALGGILLLHWVPGLGPKLTTPLRQLKAASHGRPAAGGAPGGGWMTGSLRGPGAGRLTTAH